MRCQRPLVVSGRLNKQVGGELGISEVTVKAHRGQVMRKMKADSLADLVTIATRLHLAPPRKSWKLDFIALIDAAAVFVPPSMALS